MPVPESPPILFVKTGFPSVEWYPGPTVFIATMPLAPALIADLAISQTIDGTVYVEITHRCNYSCK